jgi:hypothetical protein
MMRFVEIFNNVEAANEFQRYIRGSAGLPGFAEVSPVLDALDHEGSAFSIGSQGDGRYEVHYGLVVAPENVQVHLQHTGDGTVTMCLDWRASNSTKGSFISHRYGVEPTHVTRQISVEELARLRCILAAVSCLVSQTALARHVPTAARRREVVLSPTCNVESYGLFNKMSAVWMAYTATDLSVIELRVMGEIDQ